MGQEVSSLQKVCCNNNLCNFDSNVENISEINRKNMQGVNNGGTGIMNEEFFIRQGGVAVPVSLNNSKALSNGAYNS
jgi:hypothetical protein